MEKLLNSDACTVDIAKLTDYLLALAHPRGKAKAQFLLRFGYRAEAPHVLEGALLRHARDCEVVRKWVSPHGTKFELVGPLPSPDGRDPVVKSVWIIDHGASAPRFVTMVPEGHRSA